MSPKNGKILSINTVDVFSSNISWEILSPEKITPQEQQSSIKLISPTSYSSVDGDIKLTADIALHSKSKYSITANGVVVSSGDINPTIISTGNGYSLKFKGLGIQSASAGFKNSILVNGELATPISMDVNNLQDVTINIPDGFLLPGANKVTIRTGNTIDPITENYNHDDFNVSDVRLVLPDGRISTDPASTPEQSFWLGDGYPAGSKTPVYSIDWNLYVSELVTFQIDQASLPAGEEVEITLTITGANGVNIADSVRVISNSGSSLKITSPTAGSNVNGDVELTAAVALPNNNNYTIKANGAVVSSGELFKTSTTAANGSSLKFKGLGIQSASAGFKNSIFVNGEFATPISMDVNNFQDVSINIPDGFLLPGANKVTIRTGNTTDPINENYNHDDFNVSDVRLILPDGRVSTDPASTPEQSFWLGDGYPAGSKTPVYSIDWNLNVTELLTFHIDQADLPAAGEIEFLLTTCDANGVTRTDRVKVNNGTL